MTGKIDWGWCYENPKEAAHRIEKLQTANDRFENSSAFTEEYLSKLPWTVLEEGVPDIWKTLVAGNIRAYRIALIKYAEEGQ